LRADLLLAGEAILYLPWMQRPDALLAALGGLVALACATVPPAEEPERPPQARSLVRVSQVATVGPYLDARLSGQRFSLRFFFPQNEDCLALIRSEAEVRYLRIGTLGSVVDDEKRRCEPIGVASLREWRDFLPRQRSPHRTPRVQVEFRTIFEGENLVLVRGRFPLAMEIRWAAAMDTVAMFPADPACDEARQLGKATMEFHAKGPEPFLLVGEEGSCPILGFADPLEAD
jgi:hypothetical protein